VVRDLQVHPADRQDRRAHQVRLVHRDPQAHRGLGLAELRDHPVHRPGRPVHPVCQGAAAGPAVGRAAAVARAVRADVEEW
jgi:hypothetical protein